MNLQYFYRLALTAAVLASPEIFLRAQTTRHIQHDSNATITSLTNLSRPRRDSTPLGTINVTSSDAVNLDVSGDPALLNPENRDGRPVGSTRRSYLNQGSAHLKSSYGSSASRSRLPVPEKQQTSKAALILRGGPLQSSENDPNSFFRQTEKMHIVGADEIVTAGSNSDPGATDAVQTGFESLERLKDPFSGLLTDRFEGFKNREMERPCGLRCGRSSTDRLDSSYDSRSPRSDRSIRRGYSRVFQTKQVADSTALDLVGGRKD